MKHSKGPKMDQRGKRRPSTASGALSTEPTFRIDAIGPHRPLGGAGACARTDSVQHPQRPYLGPYPHPLHRGLELQTGEGTMAPGIPRPAPPASPVPPSTPSTPSIHRAGGMVGVPDYPREAAPSPCPSRRIPLTPSQDCALGPGGRGWVPLFLVKHHLTPGTGKSRFFLFSAQNFSQCPSAV